MASLDFFSKEESISKSSILSDGIDIFKELFGFAPVSFIANCYIWHSSIEENLFTEGIRHIQGIPYQYSPFLSKSGEKSYKRVFHYQGEKNRIGQTYFVRNVFFEPSIYNKIDSVNETMKRIEIAFRYGKPAVISTHRLNYIGSINERNQIDNLKSLKCLLSSIVRKWPDVQFIPTNKLLDVYNS
jgi:hypothetical protein